LFTELIKVIKSRRVRWVGHVAYTIFCWENPEGKRHLEKPKERSENVGGSRLDGLLSAWL
jgi:hypothetical protein